MTEFLTALSNSGNFTRNDFALAFRAENKEASDASCRFAMQKLLDSGSIARVGRNNYCVIDKTSRKYSHEYSILATSVAGKIQEIYPELDFRIFELIQLNEFVNHQIAHNALFISVEGDLGEYVFDTLKEEYAGRILLNPNVDMYHQYWADDMLVIEKLITEAPKGTDVFWHTDLEKLLVDIVADKLLRSCVNQGEYKMIFTQAFKEFYIDESQLFRYARRRNAKAKVLEQIDKSLLRTE
ncbi:DUF6577 family protein [Neglectibacter caecimuris]|jgi:hypothetical protein|uniref:DUF6577 family protein n=1 Tax=Neglectibacter caecimuris TaxID=3093658 RepID=UPI002AC9C65F|nr:DUF6577 family protein [Neglectibacter sp. M00184]